MGNIAWLFEEMLNNLAGLPEEMFGHLAWFVAKMLDNLARLAEEIFRYLAWFVAEIRIIWPSWLKKHWAI